MRTLRGHSAVAIAPTMLLLLGFLSQKNIPVISIKTFMEASQIEKRTDAKPFIFIKYIEYAGEAAILLISLISWNF